MEERKPIFGLGEVTGGICILALLFALSFRNYLLFHGLAEIFSASIAFGVFMIAWHSREFMENRYLLLLGIAYLFVGALDVLHTLAYKGMGVFPAYGADLPTQLWIAARYLESFSLLAAFLLRERPWSPRVVLPSYAVLVSLLLVSIFVPGVFPPCYVEGTGLTPFKRVSEYVICAVLAAVLVLLFKNRWAFHERVFALMALSVGATILGELAFTFYVSVYGLSNVAGHFFKIVSFYLIYKAIIRTGLEEPYDLLFRNLKRSEKKLRKSQELLNATGRIARLGGWELNPVTMGVAWTDVLYDLHEQPGDYRPELADLPAFYPGDSAGRLRRALEDAAEKGESFDMVLPFVTAKGNRRWVHAVGRAWRQGGRTERVAGTFQDITEKVEAEKALQESEQRYRSIFETAREGIWQLDGEGRTLLVNGHMALMLGCEESELAGQSFFRFMDEDAAARAEKELDNCRRGLSPSFDQKFRGKEDREIWTIVSMTPVFSGDGKFLHALAMVTDITERKLAEEKRRELEARLRHAHKMEAVGVLAGGVAHDFNNLLQAVHGYAELLLLEHAEEGRDTSKLLSIKRAAERGAELTRRLLAFGGKVKSDPRPGDLSRIVGEACERLEKSLPSTIRVEIRSEPGVEAVFVDKAQMEQVLTSLILNARDAMPAGGRLIVETASAELDEAYCRRFAEISPGRYVSLSVSDTGCGIEGKDLDRIFDPFYTTREVGKGTGLGLAMVYGVVKNHGGHVLCASEPGKGATFTIYLPLKDVAE